MIKKPKARSLTSDRYIKQFILDSYGYLFPALFSNVEKYLNSPVTDDERITFYLNKSKYLNQKCTR